MSKISWKTAALVLAIGGGILTGSLLNIEAEGAGVSGQPGTSDDPVVTKSYVDQAIKQALGGGGGTVTTPSSGTEEAGSTDGGSTEGIEIVDVKPGEILIASAGAEFIVRSGKAVIYSKDANGVADLTDGVDIVTGGTVNNNHLLSFPRDGRGIQVREGDTHNLTVMVRGGYRILK
ncbi:hypothetical protein V3851_19715 [Paenibacillus sp. M1]|uniref:Uncharacterized protein n=1 Tax=Paenibacillus haidiansis TaxID=1574488 RepID=A0ABU7VWB3_9BACL